MENKELEFNETKKTNKKRKIKCKCKPAYNFQSIEFEYEIDLDDNETICEMFDLYDDLLENLMASAPAQSVTNTESTEELATEKQIEILNKFNIKHKQNVTKKEADELIKKSIKKSCYN